MLEKPDSLANAVKNGGMPTLEDFRKFTDKYIRGYHNKQPHRGEA